MYHAVANLSRTLEVRTMSPVSQRRRARDAHEAAKILIVVKLLSYGERIAFHVSVLSTITRPAALKPCFSSESVDMQACAITPTSTQDQSPKELI